MDQPLRALAPRAWLLAQRGMDVCLIQMDLDPFKAVNDECGHEGGDEMLQLFADCLARHVRAIDIAYRFGGDECMVLLLQADIEQSKEWFERVRTDFSERQTVLYQQGPRPMCTISAGLLKLDPAGIETIAEAMRLSDTMLYAAKGAGRNQIHVAAKKRPG